jgi:nitrite reductase/ring-hydroxylating ferredoxin subunit
MITRLNILFAAFTLAFCGACSKDKLREDTIPNIYVSEQLNLTNFENRALRQDRGYVYIPGGVRGIVVFRESATRYLAFERNCPYKPFDTCATVEVDASNLFFIDPCCNSKFDFTGAVIAGPAVYPLKQYATNLTSGNILYISN